MKHKLIVCIITLFLLLSGCGVYSAPEPEYSIACTTYPVYLLANTIAGEIEGVEVSLVINQQVSCLHDYTLTIQDMKTLEAADVVAMNGAGLEDFLGDTLEGKTVIDCAQGIELLDEEEDDDHDHGEEHHHHEDGDPHIWMDPSTYAQMARTLSQTLAEQDPDRGEAYLSRGEDCARELEAFYDDLMATDRIRALSGSQLITFHDGFAYFARAFGMEIAAAIEEEEGAEASAKDLKETIRIVQECQLPAVFTEVNGSTNAANTIQQECGVQVQVLSMVMSGETGDTITAYETAIQQNLDAIVEVYE